MRRSQLDLASQPVRNTITNPAMITKTSGTDIVLTNYAPNPDFTGDTVSMGNIGGSPASWTSTAIATDRAHSGTRSFKLATCTVAGQAGRKQMLNPATALKIQKGQKVSWSCWIYSTVAGTINPYWEGKKVSDNTYTGGGSATVTVAANQWTYVSGTQTLSYESYIEGAGAYGLAVNVGDSVWFDDFCITQTDTPQAYFDGNTPAANGYTYSWSGTAYNSASVRKASAAIVRTNLVANPTFKGGTLTNIRVNNVMNPSFKTTSGTTDVRKNLAINPSFEATTGTPTVRTNLISYPNFETSNTVQAIRTNICTNPRGVNGFDNYAGIGTITPNVAITGHPDGITTANRVEYAANAVNPGVTLMTPLVSGTQYTASAWVYHETVPGGGSQGLAQSGIASQPSPPAITQGSWVRFSWTFTASGTSSLGFRVSSPPGAGSFLITGILIETRPDLGKFFDGATPAQQNLITNPSFATNTTGWSPISATLTRVTNQGGDGHACEIAQTIEGGTRNTAIWLIGSDYNPGGYTVSFDMKGTDASFTNVRVLLYDTETALVRGQGTTPLIKDGNFNRYTFTLTADGVFDKIYMEVQGVGIPIGAKAWLDRAQLERSNTASPFYYEGNGDFTYAWGGTANASTSIQNATTFLGWGQLGAIYRSMMDPKMGTYSGALLSRGINGDGLWPSTNLDVIAGRTYTYSLWVKATTAHALTAGFRWYDASMVQVGSDTNVTVTSQLVVGSWALVSATATAPTNAVKLQMMLRIYETHTPTTFYVDGAICVESMVPVPYFDGSTAASGDFTYAWSGTVNASASLQRGVGVTENAVFNAVPISSTEWKAVGPGARSLRLVPHLSHITDSYVAVSGDFGAMRLGMLAGRTYTVSATIRLSAPLTGTLSTKSRKIVFYHKSPADQNYIETTSAQAANVAGETRLSVTVTIPDTATEAFVRLYNGAAAGNGDVWWDNLLVEEATALRPYFDGTYPAIQNLVKTAATPNGGTTITTGVSYAGLTWNRSTVPIGASVLNTRQYVAQSDLTAGGTLYTVAVTLANDQAFTQSVTLDWCDTGFVSVTLAAGEVRRVVTTSSRSVYDSIYRFADLAIQQSASETRSVLYKDWIIEEGTTSGEYYSGTGDFTYAWSGTADASTSVQRAPIPVGSNANINTSIPNARFFRYQATDEFGKKYNRWFTPAGTAASGWRVAAVTNLSLNTPSIVAGQTYTLILRHRSSGWTSGNFAGIGLMDATGGNVVIGFENTPLNTSGWQTYKRTFTALIGGLSTTNLYIALPANHIATTDGLFDISEWALVEGSYTGSFFDGSTAASASLSYAWNGTADASISYEKGTALATGTYTVESKLASYVSSSGTFIVHVKEPNGAGGRSFVPTQSVGQTLIFTEGKKYTVKMRGRKFNSATGYRLAGTTIQEMPLTTSMATHTMTFTAGAVPTLYIEHPQSSNDAGTEWEYFGVFEEGDPISYFDGDTSGAEGLMHRWKGTPYASQSEQFGAAVTGYSLEPNIKRWALPWDGAMRTVNISGTTHSLQTESGSMVTGRTYTALFRAKLYGSATNVKVYGITGTPTVTLTSSYAWYRVTGVATDTRLYFSTNGAPAGSGFDMSHLMVVEGTYTGGYVDGTSYGARWEGTTHAATSLGHPTSLESIAGKPLFSGTTAGNFVLDPTGVPETSARTIYSIVDNILDVATSGMSVVLSYGASALDDVVPNKYLTIRQQSTDGPFNQVLTRRTAGGGPWVLGVPSSGRQILIGGIDGSGYLFSGVNNSSLATDNLTVAMPHEKIWIGVNTSYHNHVITYVYAGYHNDSMRAEIIKLLSLKHNVPL